MITYTGTDRHTSRKLILDSWVLKRVDMMKSRQLTFQRIALLSLPWSKESIHIARTSHQQNKQRLSARFYVAPDSFMETRIRSVGDVYGLATKK